MDCPVCPRTKIEEDVCPQCGTDLKPLLRLAELPSVYAQVGSELLSSGRPDEAISNLLTADALDGSSAEVQTALARAFAVWRRYPEALWHFDRALALAPANDEIRSERAAAEMHQGPNAPDKSASAREAPFRPFRWIAPIAAFLIGISVPLMFRTKSPIPVPSGPSTHQPPGIIEHTATPSEIKYSVRNGDSFWSIAKRSYGNADLWRAIRSHNLKHGWRGSLHPGQVLSLPAFHAINSQAKNEGEK